MENLNNDNLLELSKKLKEVCKEQEKELKEIEQTQSKTLFDLLKIGGKI